MDNEESLGMRQRLRELGARGWGAVRRHPWLAAASLPTMALLMVLLYVLALVPLTPSIGDIKKSKQEHPTVVLSSDGKELAVFKRANRDWVKLSQVSPHVVTALLATEDHRFYEHPGLDVKRTARAAVNTLTGDREGGSTITQQLARNLYPEEIGRAPTLTRKVKEAITALKIEAVFSKDEILESYLNSVSFLYNAWGIEMAARTYFDKPASKLDELEAATLVGMLKGTSYYNPVLNPERALQRRNTVLSLMAKEGKLPQARHAALKELPLKLDFSRVPEFNGPAPHLAEALKRWLLDWADKHDYNIYADGLVVRTTIDSRLQKMANDAVQRQGDALQAVADVEWSKSGLTSLGSNAAAYAAMRDKVDPFGYFWNAHKDLIDAFVRDTPEFRALREQKVAVDDALKQLKSDDKFMRELRADKTRVQAGFLALDPNSGAIKAWVGSRGYDEDKYDHVQQARRQPGSTFKPFVYGAAFEQGMSPNAQLMDAQMAIQIDKGKVWRPGDVGEGPTNQPMTLRQGLAKSKNTITAQLMMQVGPSRVASLARAMGVRQSKLDEVPSLALGTSPVTLKEMVSAFGSIANGGSYIEPHVVTGIENRQGESLESFSKPAPEQAMTSQAAMTLLDVLRGVIDEGTAVGLRSRFGIKGDVAGKTGTTQDNTDGWFILMHPQLVAGAWMGFNDNRITMRSDYWGQGAHNALLVVGDFMQQGLKASVIEEKAAFAAPRQSAVDAQQQPLLDRMNDWFSSVFSSPSQSGEVIASPPAQINPPALQSPAIQTIVIGPSGTAASPGVASGEAPRAGDFPRQADAARPADNVSGTWVYRNGEVTRVPQGAESGREAGRMPAELQRVPEMRPGGASDTTRLPAELQRVPELRGGSVSMGAPSLPPPPSDLVTPATGSPTSQ